MRNQFIIFIAVSFLLLFSASYAQISNPSNLATPNPEYVGWNGIGGNTKPLDIRNIFNQPIHFFTYNNHRMRINGDLTWQCGGFASQTVNGYVGISPTGFFNNNSPWSMLHLDGPDNTGAGGVSNLGWRPWMKTGVFMKENSDAMYVGMQAQGDDENRSDAVINWSDDFASPLGPDRLKIVFTSVGGGGNNPLNCSSLQGYEFMEFSAFPTITNNTTGYPVGHVGIGPTFTAAALPQSRLHINAEEDLETWLQISNATGTGQTEFDGFRVGILGDGGTVNFRQQENFPMMFYTNFNNANVGNANWERMRITDINAIGTTGFAPNITRVSISEDGDLPVTIPRSLLHLGYNTGTTTNPTAVDGWRPWMDVGTFISEKTDHLYIGMKNEGPLLGDRSDAVIGWGDNHHQDLAYPYGQGPDNLRFIFTGYAGATGVDQRVTSADGLEVGRFSPDGNFGIGDFTASIFGGLNQQPQQRLDVDGNARIRQMPITANFFNTVTIDGNGDLWQGPAANIGFGLPCNVTPTWDLTYDWRVGLKHNTLYFDGQGRGWKDNVAIGYTCIEPIFAKLHVVQREFLSVDPISLIGDMSVAGAFFSIPNPSFKSTLSVGTVGWSTGDTKYGCGVVGIGDIFDANYNVYGVYGESRLLGVPTTGNNLWAGYFNGSIFYSGALGTSDSTLKMGKFDFIINRQLKA